MITLDQINSVLTLFQKINGYPAAHILVGRLTGEEIDLFSHSHADPFKTGRELFYDEYGWRFIVVDKDHFLWCEQ